jgi:hypothetical protein
MELQVLDPVRLLRSKSLCVAVITRNNFSTRSSHPSNLRKRTETDDGDDRIVGVINRPIDLFSFRVAIVLW